MDVECSVSDVRVNTGSPYRDRGTDAGLGEAHGGALPGALCPTFCPSVPYIECENFMLLHILKSRKYTYLVRVVFWQSGACLIH